MKKLALSIAALLALLSVRSQADQIKINLYAAQLLTSGSTAVPDNMLVQLVGDTTSTFGAPTASSFDGTDPNETVLWSGTVSLSNSGVAGGVASAISLTPGGLDTAVGDYLALRWFPTLTTSASSPGAGTTYGQFSTLATENSSDIDWQVPAAGTYTLNFLTASQAGSEPNSAGVADLTTAAVPEPASLSAIAGAFAIGAMALRRRRK